MILAFGLAAAGCYSPSVSSGGLTCAAPPAKQCPDGFHCATGVCVKTGAVGPGGSGGAMGTGGAVHTGGTIGSGGSTGTGGGPPPSKQIGEACLIMNQGQPSQSDNCATGLLCVDDCGGSGARCYKTCQGDGDCAQSACTRTAPGGVVRFCEVPYATCNPQNTASSGCGAGTGCYLLSPEASPAGGDRTVCDCSMSAGGLGEVCSDSRGCFPGLVCPPVCSPGADACRRICDPAAASTGCPAATTCRAFGGKWGYCF